MSRGLGGLAPVVQRKQACDWEQIIAGCYPQQLKVGGELGSPLWLKFIFGVSFTLLGCHPFTGSLFPLLVCWILQELGHIVTLL